MGIHQPIFIKIGPLTSESLSNQKKKAMKSRELNQGFSNILLDAFLP